MFSHFVLLAVSEQAKTWLTVFFPLMYCIIKQLLEEAFVISIITKVLVRGITVHRPWLFWLSQKPHPWTCSNKMQTYTKQWILLWTCAILLNLCSVIHQQPIIKKPCGLQDYTIEKSSWLIQVVKVTPNIRQFVRHMN